ncbi:MAG: response regulator transcription factor [Candidatus Omnitrophica bacterium]|nr:response regulator transcription factor [Candidatus Omnitrophota bacterium]
MESLLLVGSDEARLKRIRTTLIKGGFRVSLQGIQDLNRLEESRERFSLGLLDVSGEDGVAAWVERVRSKVPAKELPLIVLVKQGQADELPGLGGVEDFVVLPLELELLESRLRFVLKRLNHLAPGTGIRIGALELDPDRYEVSLDGEPLELTYKEFELFKFLATHPGRVFSRDQLLNQVWGYDFIGGTRTVDVHIRRLRAKLGPKYASLIDTVRNVGYKFLESL